MKIKILLSALLVSGIVTAGFSQIKQADTSTRYRTIIPTEKQKRLSNIDFIANQQYQFRSDFTDGDYLGSKFKMEQFRMEIRGWITDRVFFRFRHRYTSPFEPQTVDKIVKGVDMAYLTVKLGNNDKWDLTVGKFCVDWGGMEFDLNPIDIYEYSDIIEQADNFLSGAGVKYNVNKSNYVGIQVYNSRTQTFDELYGNDSIIGGAGITMSKAPLGVVVTWRGSLWNGLVNTLWSYSLTNEASGMFKNYAAFGQQLNLSKIKIAYDFKISFEDLDRTGIISKEIPRDQYGYVLLDTKYMSHWMRIDYSVNDKWHLCFDGFIDFADWMGDEDPTKTENRIRTAYSYIPTVEFYPWSDINLKFFVGYVGRIFKYSDYAKDRINVNDYSTGRVMIGLITPLKFL